MPWEARLRSRRWLSSEAMRELAYVALGSNLGDRAALLAAARSALSLIPATSLAAASRVEETVPLGGAAQAPYLNQMVALSTDLSPLQLLARMQVVEQQLGRTRARRWASRTMDLDIVRFGNVHMSHPRLALPHPGLRDRDFWARELSELDALLEAGA